MPFDARRRFIAAVAGLAALPVLPARAAEHTNDLAALVKDITGGKPVREGRVRLDIPRLADNGHSVLLEVTVESPMTASDHVRRIVLLSERNPRPVIATYHLGPKSGKAFVATRIRLNGTQSLLALAELSDGSFWSTKTEVIVTESACLDAS